MARIRPISDLRNKSQELSAECHRTGEPILITKNGREDLVLMSVARFERDQARLALYAALEDAEADRKRGDRGVSLRAVRERLGAPRPRLRRRAG